MEDRNGNKETTDYEKEKYAEIVDMAEYIDEDIEYSDVYNYAVDKVQNTVLHNLERWKIWKKK